MSVLSSPTLRDGDFVNDDPAFPSSTYAAQAAPALRSRCKRQSRRTSMASCSRIDSTRSALTRRWVSSRSWMRNELVASSITARSLRESMSCLMAGSGQDQLVAVDRARQAGAPHVSKTPFRALTMPSRHAARKAPRLRQHPDSDLRSDPAAAAVLILTSASVAAAVCLCATALFVRLHICASIDLYGA